MWIIAFFTNRTVASSDLMLIATRGLEMLIENGYLNVSMLCYLLRGINKSTSVHNLLELVNGTCRRF